MAADNLTIGGEKAVEIDLANSQPYFMAGIFTDVPGLAGSVCDGSFYPVINRHLDHPYDLADSDQKRVLKRQSLMCIYARPKHGFEWYEKTITFFITLQFSLC